MYADLPSQLLKDRRLRGVEVRVYCVLANKLLIGDGDFEQTIVNELMPELGEPHYKIWQAIQNLCRYGYIQQTSSFNRFRLLKEHELDGQQHAVARKFDALEYDLPWPELKPAWEKWINYYQGRFDRVDIMQAEELVAHISSLLKQNCDIVSAINYSIAGGYRQIFNRFTQTSQYERHQDSNGQSSYRKETPFERQRRINREKRARKDQPG